MKVLFASSEVAPFAKTGGLADVAGSLPQAIAALGHDVRIIMPRYQRIDPARFRLKHIVTLYVPLASWKERCDVLEGKLGNVTVYFINKDIYFDRPELYRTTRADYTDNSERFIFFSRSILEFCRAIGFSPDIIHCNDWQTGPVSLYLKTLYAGKGTFEHTKTVFSIHNLGYQGVFWHWDLRLLGLGWDIFTPDGIEFWGKINFLKAALVYSDIISTVSKTYSKEIRTPEHGHGLEGVLSRRAADLYGILNGIDYREWDPGHDTRIAHPFSASDPSGKAACKQAVQTKAGLPRVDAPLVGMVTRLAEQKGLDIVIEALPKLIALGIQIIILGTGDERYHQVLAGMASKYKNQMKVILDFDETTARSIYAGSDMFLMPSQYEPCGLGQMIALRYGSVPVVRKTGGLVDTVVPYSPKTSKSTGFVFKEYSADALVACMRKALTVFGHKKKWLSLIRSGMKQDFSWERAAREYVKLYGKALARRKTSGSKVRKRALGRG